MMKVHDAITSLLLLFSISRGSSFQPLVKVHHDRVISTVVEPSRIIHHERGYQHQPPQPLKRVPRHGSWSVLQMGLVEDFLSGADASQREVENNKYIAELQQRVTRINALESTIEELGDDELEQKTMEFKHRIQQKGESINGPLLEEAFAVVREAAWYVFKEQLLGFCEIALAVAWTLRILQYL